jgi:hypothetical protein
LSGEPKLIYVDWEGALYRGFARGWPTEVWSPRERRFVLYRGKTPKPIEWGEEIDEAEALNMMMHTMPTKTATAQARRRFRHRQR